MTPDIKTVMDAKRLGFTFFAEADYYGFPSWFWRRDPDLVTLQLDEGGQLGCPSIEVAALNAMQCLGVALAPVVALLEIGTKDASTCSSGSPVGGV